MLKGRLCPLTSPFSMWYTVGTILMKYWYIIPPATHAQRNVSRLSNKCQSVHQNTSTKYLLNPFYTTVCGKCHCNFSTVEWKLKSCAPLFWRHIHGHRWQELIIHTWQILYFSGWLCSLKAGSQYDAGASVALWASEWRWSWLKFNLSIASPALVSVQTIRFLSKNLTAGTEFDW